ncbi:MAG: type III pantothenate kinase [Phycisphaerae bacterium]|nr:type III pantothenate kinase [Phycisphaerae bacterium]
MKIIAVDIGNTMTRLAVVEERKVLEKVALAADEIEQFGDELVRLMKLLEPQKVRPVVVCSVAPKTCATVEELVRRRTDSKPLVIGRDIPLPLRLDLSDASTVGADRVVAAAMAYERMETAVVVADFGTAVTIDCVNDEGVFLGGAILSGLRLSAYALSSYTAALPLVSDPSLPVTPWGRNTVEAISSGIILGAVGALREIVERYATELGRWPEVILTGGDATLIAEHNDFAKAVAPDLLLMGVDLAYELWAESQED